MKRVKTILSFLFVLALSTQVTNAQLRKIPAAVTESLKSKYGTATNVEWKDRLTSYAASFDLNGKKHEAHFDDDGTWKHTQIMIEHAELPAAVNDGFQKSKYADWEVSRVEKIEKNDNSTEYRIQVKKGDVRKKNLLFTSDGRMKKDNITV
ncbi:MAG TPA: PepSY-like domain-containing protein [Chitinophagaceae bacterium]